jgi:CcmD family protein
MTYLVIAYVIFWAIIFVLVFSVFARQKAAERELDTLKIIIEQETDRSSDGEHN